MILATFWSIVDTFGTLKAFLGLLWIIFGSMAIAIQLNHVFYTVVERQTDTKVIIIPDIFLKMH